MCLLQAVEEVLSTMEPVFAKHPELIPVMERLVEPERMIAFRVAWVDDKGKQQARPSRRACCALLLFSYVRAFLVCFQGCTANLL